MFPVDNIRLCCSIAGITLAELERELNIGNGVIARWSKNKSAPPIDRLSQIAERFGVTIEALSTPDFPAWEFAAMMSKKEKRPATNDGSKVIAEFLLSLPKDRLRGILLALEAPQAVFDALGLPEPQK